MQPTETRTASQAAARNTATALQSAGISQREMARTLGWSAARASRRLNAIGVWPIEDVIAVAEFLHVSVDDLTSEGAAA